MGAIEVEKRLAVPASGQWGLVTTPQATAQGVSYSQLNRLVERAVLNRLSHGVYQLRSAPADRHVDLRAAWLALDPKRTAGERLQEPTSDAIVSHASAAAFRGWGDLAAYDSEFTFDGRKQTRRADVRLHRGSTRAADVEIVNGLPVTTAERLVTDLLAANYDFDHIGAVLAGAIRDRAVDLEQLAVRATRYATRLGVQAANGTELISALVESGGAQHEAAADRLVRLARNSPRAEAGLRALLASIGPLIEPGAVAGLRDVIADSPSSVTRVAAPDAVVGVQPREGTEPGQASE